MKRKLITLLLAASLAACSGCGAASKEGGALSSVNSSDRAVISEVSAASPAEESAPAETATPVPTETPAPTALPTPTPSPAPESDEVTSEAVAFDPNWTYAGNSQIHTGTAVLYTAKPSLKKGITVCVNAGHGTEGGESVYTLCHPDGSAKVTGGSTAAGSTYAMAVAGGTTLLDGTPERSATFSLALLLKDKLLNNGYNVLMIRESDDVQLDNIARTLMANNLADCHIALHYDSTESDKGAFYMSVPDNASYRAMEPVASTWENDDLLGDSVIRGLSAAGVKIYSSGSLEADLTQTSYSTVPSIDLEVGDRASDHSENAQSTIADGIVQGVTNYFGR